MKIGRDKLASYVKASDVNSPALVTIRDVQEETIGQGEQEKHVLYVEEYEDGIVLNKTSLKQLVNLFGDETNEWVGQTVVMFNDFSVKFEGKNVGGIRFRAPKTQANNKAEKSAKPGSDEIPF